MSLSAERLREIVSYDETTGAFSWRITRSNKAIAGHAAGHVNKNGYESVRIDGRLYLAHRLAWLYVHGQWPNSILDHINRDPGDNRIANLRPATHSQNHANTSLRADNKTGVRGLRWIPSRRRWNLVLRKDGRPVYCGTFLTKEEAAASLPAAMKRLHGEFGG